MLESLFFYFGLIYLTEFLFELYPLLLSFTSKADFKKYQGSWAIITGSTDGIGLGYCEFFAKQGINIIQISRTPSKLTQVATDLNSKYGVQVKNIARDFSQCTKDPKKFFTEIFNEIGDLDVKILVNNVGNVSVSIFHKKKIEQLLFENALNLWPIVYMTRLLINKNKDCLVINLSSVSGTFGFPYLVAYSAGKSFDKVFSNIISEEGINATCLQPGFVATQLTKGLKKKTLEISVEDYINATMKQVEKVKNSYGHWKHYAFSSITYFTSGNSNIFRIY